MPTVRLRHALVILAMLVGLLPGATPSVAGLPDTIDKIRPSVVGVGTFQYTGRPQSKFHGTGFVVADGRHILTNAHVVPKHGDLDHENREYLAIFTGRGNKAQSHQVKEIARDEDHDISVLELLEGRLPAMEMGESDSAREGEEYAFTGFPIGMVIGLYPVTARGIVSAITPIIEPVYSSRQLNPALIRRLKDQYGVLQLDATAYPGNSGSPVYHPETGKVIGIINKVFVKETKEMVIEKPSGITYAIPIKFAKDLLRAHKIPH